MMRRVNCPQQHGSCRMLRHGAAFVLCLSALAFTGCGEEDEAGGGPYVHQDGAYFSEDWESSYTLVSGCEQSRDHSGLFVTVWANPTAIESPRPFLEGSVVLKAQYQDESCMQLAGVTAMEKGAAGSAPASGDWDWQQVNGDGSIGASGQLSQCSGCHSGASDPSLDYVFTAFDPE